MEPLPSVPSLPLFRYLPRPYHVPRHLLVCLGEHWPTVTLTLPHTYATLQLHDHNLLPVTFYLHTQPALLLPYADYWLYVLTFTVTRATFACLPPPCAPYHDACRYNSPCTSRLLPPDYTLYAPVTHFVGFYAPLFTRATAHARAPGSNVLPAAFHHYLLPLFSLPAFCLHCYATALRYAFRRSLCCALWLRRDHCLPPTYT